MTVYAIVTVTDKVSVADMISVMVAIVGWCDVSGVCSGCCGGCYIGCSDGCCNCLCGGCCNGWVTVAIQR